MSANHQSQSKRDKALEDAEAAKVMSRGMQTAIAEVANRGTTFAALRSAVETLVGRGCDSHGLDHSTYRVRFVTVEQHPDLGGIAIASDYTLDLSESDSDWIALNAVAVDPQVRLLLERL